jgi:hypothetical protein
MIAPPVSDPNTLCVTGAGREEMAARGTVRTSPMYIYLLVVNLKCVYTVYASSWLTWPMNSRLRGVYQKPDEDVFMTHRRRRRVGRDT